jgi:L-aminopeptidase/D-esterase-like protein
MSAATVVGGIQDIDGADITASFSFAAAAAAPAADVVLGVVGRGNMLSALVDRLGIGCDV